MLPAMQRSCTPSMLQTNLGCWFGMQPPSTQTRPPEHAPASSHGVTQCSCTQVVPAEQAPPPSAAPHGLELPVQTEFCRSQVKPVGHGIVAEQAGVQTPFTHSPLLGHCVESEHWLEAE